jgi:hypothetical protein
MPQGGAMTYEHDAILSALAQRARQHASALFGLLLELHETLTPAEQFEATAAINYLRTLLAGPDVLQDLEALKERAAKIETNYLERPMRKLALVRKPSNAQCFLAATDDGREPEKAS